MEKNGNLQGGVEEIAEEQSTSDLPPRGNVRSIISKIENSLKSGGKKQASDNERPDTKASSFTSDDSKDDERLSLRTPSPEGDASGIFKWLPSLGSLNRRKKRDSASKRSSSFYSPTDEFIASDTDSLTFRDVPSPSLSAEKEDSNISVLDSDAESLHTNDSLAGCADAPSKAFLVAKEMVTTEEHYISSLRLLNVTFRNVVEMQNHASKDSIIHPEDLHKLLSHLPQLQTLSEDICLDLNNRIQNWDKHAKIADVIVKKGPFLKMYSSYLENFKTNSQFFLDCCSKYPKFKKLVKDFESQSCNKLEIMHYMLKPIQRLPQYRLLLLEYLKHLTETSPDYADAQTALSIVTDANEYVNNRLEPVAEHNRMAVLQSMIGDFSLIKAGRKLIKDGPLNKLCRKTVKHRYFILLSDCLIYSSPSKSFLNVNQTLPLDGMKVEYYDDDINLYTFKVFSKTKSFILSAESETERKEWVEAINHAIEDHVARKKSFMLQTIPKTPQNFHLGKEAPLWIQDSKVTMCQICAAEFTQLYRRHHCRACGKVICWKCSDNFAPLQYKSYKPTRVCDNCFEKLLEDYEANEDAIKSSIMDDGVGEEEARNIYLGLKTKFSKSNNVIEKERKQVPTWLTEVSAKDSAAEMSGWLRRWKSHRWKTDKEWYVLKDRVLYIYRASEDIAAVKSISVLGYKILRGEENMDGVRADLVFQLTHRQQQPIIYAADTQDLADRWFQSLTKASEMT